MKQNHHWITSTGGPHVLIAEECLKHWRGIEGWRDNDDPINQSSYASACRISTWLGLAKCGDGSAVVLSGDAGDIAWFPRNDDEGGHLIQWIAIDDETQIEPLLLSLELVGMLASKEAEHIEFATGETGRMWLFDSSETGNALKDEHEILALRPGRYLIRANYYNGPALSIVVREVLRLAP
jgi:hypothetical protein